MADFWDGRCVLVTGACGFVGANLVKALCGRGALVVGVDLSLSSPSLRALCGPSHPSVIVGDVTDLSAMVNCIGGARPEVVFHLAGYSHIGASQEAPFDAFRVNAMGTVAVLEAVRRTAPRAAVVCASSNHLYLGGGSFPGMATMQPREEGDFLDAVDVYGTSKIMADVAVRCYRESYDLRAAAVRHVNAYGPADPHDSHLVTGAILACLRGERPRLRSDGSAVKGYLHVADIVGAYLTVAEGMEELPGHAVNVASPACEASSLEIAHEVMRAAGMDGEPEVLAADLSQKGYVERLDDSLIQRLGWHRAFGLRTGIADAFAWYKAHGAMAWRAD